MSRLSLEIAPWIRTASILLLVGCQSQARLPEAGAGVFEVNQEVKLAYQIQGSGSPTLLFLHGWSCNQSHWRHQVPAFVEDHTVITVDLAGHGASSTTRDRWTVPDLGADVAAMVKGWNLQDVILIGHSMGGPVAAEAAARIPDRVLGIIAADTFHNVETKLDPEAMQPWIEGMEADFQGFCQQFLDAMFAQQADPELKEIISASMMETDPNVAIGLMKSYFDFSLSDSVKACPVPIRCINAMQPKTEFEINRKYGDFDAVLMEDVNHFLMLEEPEAFNQHLRRWVNALQERGSN
ncbi:MAG: alpha/beta hydrolase [Planctomycetota bacterium]|nr:MAG: alpha/beta hydrolase [Planctomycetota bacterium]